MSENDEKCVTVQIFTDSALRGQLVLRVSTFHGDYTSALMPIRASGNKCYDEASDCWMLKTHLISYYSIINCCVLCLIVSFKYCVLFSVSIHFKVDTTCNCRFYCLGQFDLYWQLFWPLPCCLSDVRPSTLFVKIKFCNCTRFSNEHINTLWYNLLNN